MKPSIRLVTAWGGAIPTYLPLFFGTAAYNPTIEFLFVADSPQPFPLPANVQWVERSMPDLLASMGERLGCDLSHAEPYKLCDFKPTFGVALADLLEGCDFWGHVDCDLILGDLRAFATDNRLAEHDVLSFWGRGFVHGPLTLWRNTEDINRLYERADWQQIFEAPEYLGFDETGKRWSSPAARRPIPVAERHARGEVPCITDIVYEAAAAGTLRIYDEEHIVQARPRAVVPHLALRWERGRLIDAVSQRPLAFFHIHWAKSDAERGDPAYVFPSWHWDTLPERFGITRQRIGPIDAMYYAACLRSLGPTLRRSLRTRAGRVRRAVRRRLRSK
ncbi:MAG: hypothetical protein M3220_13420 [Chloroflexota bacterium]|nr:hypothetical protein [Chloroflexota bacterium]